jgi:hypothetical protein
MLFKKSKNQIEITKAVDPENDFGIFQIKKRGDEEKRNPL